MTLLREAHFTSSALGDQLGLLSVVCLNFAKLTLSSGRVITLLPLGVLTEIFKYCVFSLFLDQFDQRLTLHICGLGVPENGTFHCFWSSLIRSSDLGSVDWGFPKTVTFDCWNSVDYTCASRPCSAECCLVN